MRTRATLAVRLVTRVTRVTRVDIPKTLYKVTFEPFRSYMHMRTFFQQNPPLVFGRALLLKSKIHYISIDLDHGA